MVYSFGVKEGSVNDEKLLYFVEEKTSSKLLLVKRNWPNQ